MILKKCLPGLLISILFLMPVTGLADSGYEAKPDSVQFKKIFKWNTLSPLPDSIGVAGAFVGQHNGVLIVAGGANFPDNPPWKSGEKVYHDQIYVLEKKNGNYQWYGSGQLVLPHPLAYGVSISTNRGIICIGGTDGEKVYNEVFILKWNSE